MNKRIDLTETTPCGCKSIRYFTFLSFLTPVAVVKGLACGIASAVAVLVSWSVMSVLLWPLDVARTYAALWRTKLLGPNLKAISLMLLPIPMILYLVRMYFASVFIGLSSGFSCAYEETMQCLQVEPQQQCRVAANPLTAGWRLAVMHVLDIIHRFWDFNVNELREFLGDVERHRGRVYEVHLQRVPAAVVLGLVSGPATALSTALVVVWRIPAVILQCWQMTLTWACRSSGCCTPCPSPEEGPAAAEAGEAGLKAPPSCAAPGCSLTQHHQPMPQAAVPVRRPPPHLQAGSKVACTQYGEDEDEDAPQPCHGPIVVLPALLALLLA
eukprot:CAMPEP_0202917672 /NCGR_PEP_ID=MMETSP1392-20130828/71562_1 /ASSEMBLY_ACC=CAM_ASM_000868 /TAXON_ID=225041 /ORGANISM="Chlamydomonas chlamydogama, Strain SAG 11-48b" /LENGTH=326 /DNA_ID=CAMNT_0049610493 /DNA_START=129 /DNA_END=1106 /DNA_ORIENTATION=+